jgi:tetratricopeptide (TPR) repeat protein
MIRQCASPAFIALALLLLFTGACTASEAKQAAAEGGKLYDAGDYDAALPLLEKAAQKGLSDGELFYQLGYIYDLKSMPAKGREYREKSLPLLEKQVKSPDATLESWYYLAALYANLDRPEDRKKTAAEAAAKFGERSDLSGSDLFRLGRLYQFAGDGSRQASAYHRAVEAFSKESSPNATLHALALLSDARTDFQSHRFAEAGKKYQEAASINPRNAPPPYETALAHLGAGETEQAVADFQKVRDENLISEAQYGADLARHLRDAGGIASRTADGKPLQELDNPALEAAIRSAAGTVRSAREALSAGKGAAAAVRGAEQSFFSLVAEWMLRGNTIREAALSGRYADLIRR